MMGRFPYPLGIRENAVVASAPVSFHRLQRNQREKPIVHASLRTRQDAFRSWFLEVTSISSSSAVVTRLFVVGQSCRRIAPAAA